MATRFTSLATGTSLSLSLASVAAVGALILGGPTYVDRDQNTIVRGFYGTGAYLIYDDVPCTNTGGLAKYTSCLYQNPLTSTGVLQTVQVDSYKAPTASPITCVTSPDGTSTGAALVKYVATASGRSVISRPASGPGTLNGSGSVALLLPPSHYIRCWHSTTPGPGLKEQLRVWMSEQYIP